MVRSIFVGVLVSVLSACGQSEAEITGGASELAQDGSGARIRVTGLSANSVQRLSITANPGAITRDLQYDTNTGSFTGYLSLPVGAYSLVANAYVSDLTDGGSTLVGTGRGEVTITAGALAAVSLKVLDTTAARPQGDIGPIIRNFSVSKLSPAPGEVVSVSVDAVDLDGDALTYTWSDDCGGLFEDAASGVTTWSNPKKGSCLLKCAVKSKSQTDVEAVWLQVADSGSGTVNINGDFVSRPHIGSIYTIYTAAAGDGGLAYTTLYRGSNNLVLGPVPGGSLVESWPEVETRGAYTTQITDGCGGSANDGGRGWTAPQSHDGGIACKVTVTVTNTAGLKDWFSFGVDVR